MVVHAFNPSTQKTKASESLWIWDQSGNQSSRTARATSKTLSVFNNNKMPHSDFFFLLWDNILLYSPVILNLWPSCLSLPSKTFTYLSAEWGLNPGPCILDKHRATLSYIPSPSEKDLFVCMWYMYVCMHVHMDADVCSGVLCHTLLYSLETGSLIGSGAPWFLVRLVASKCQ